MLDLRNEIDSLATVRFDSGQHPRSRRRACQGSIDPRRRLSVLVCVVDHRDFHRLDMPFALLGPFDVRLRPTQHAWFLSERIAWRFSRHRVISVRFSDFLQLDLDIRLLLLSRRKDRTRKFVSFWWKAFRRGKASVLARSVDGKFNDSFVLRTSSVLLRTNTCRSRNQFRQCLVVCVGTAASVCHRHLTHVQRNHHDFGTCARCAQQVRNICHTQHDRLARSRSCSL